METKSNMLKLLSLIGILSVFVIGTNAAAFSHFSPSKDHPGKCVTETGEILAVGEVIPDKRLSCGKVECQNEHGLIYYESCGVVGYPKNCTMKYIKPDAKYPKCCEFTINCGDELVEKNEIA